MGPAGRRRGWNRWMELIVALDMSQHVKHLSEISDVLEGNCNSIFTLVPLAARRFLPYFCCPHGTAALNTNEAA